MSIKLDLAEMAIITTLESVGGCASTALYLKQSDAYKNNNPSIVQEQKRTELVVTQTLEGISKLERGQLPSDDSSIPFHAGLNSYLKDKKQEILEIFSKAKMAIEEGKHIEEALKGLEWYGNLVEERTSNKKRYLNRMICGPEL